MQSGDIHDWHHQILARGDRACEPSSGTGCSQQAKHRRIQHSAGMRAPRNEIVAQRMEKHGPVQHDLGNIGEREPFPPSAMDAVKLSGKTSEPTCRMETRTHERRRGSPISR